MPYLRNISKRLATVNRYYVVTLYGVTHDAAQNCAKYVRFYMCNFQ
jgi:hypothetical protein